MEITRKSMFTGIVRTLDLDVTPYEIDRYLIDGILLQDAFPTLNASDREFIKTGITSEEWAKNFGEDN